jgi:hypothetical protein
LRRRRDGAAVGFAAGPVDQPAQRERHLLQQGGHAVEGAEGGQPDPGAGQRDGEQRAVVLDVFDQRGVAGGGPQLGHRRLAAHAGSTADGPGAVPDRPLDARLPGGQPVGRAVRGAGLVDLGHRGPQLDQQLGEHGVVGRAQRLDPQRGRPAPFGPHQHLMRAAVGQGQPGAEANQVGAVARHGAAQVGGRHGGLVFLDHPDAGPQRAGGRAAAPVGQPAQGLGVPAPGPHLGRPSPAGGGGAVEQVLGGGRVRTGQGGPRGGQPGVQSRDRPAGRRQVGRGPGQLAHRHPAGAGLTHPASQ